MLPAAPHDHTAQGERAAVVLQAVPDVARGRPPAGGSVALRVWHSVLRGEDHGGHVLAGVEGRAAVTVPLRGRPRIDDDLVDVAAIDDGRLDLILLDLTELDRPRLEQSLSSRP